MSEETPTGRPSSVESHRVALALAEEVPNVLAYQDPGANVAARLSVAPPAAEPYN